MSRIAATRAYLVASEPEKPPFPIHVVATALLTAGTALVAAWWALHAYQP